MKQHLAQDFAKTHLTCICAHLLACDFPLNRPQVGVGFIMIIDGTQQALFQGLTCRADDLQCCKPDRRLAAMTEAKIMNGDKVSFCSASEGANTIQDGMCEAGANAIQSVGVKCILHPSDNACTQARKLNPGHPCQKHKVTS